jgi:hypothetical protein
MSIAEVTRQRKVFGNGFSSMLACDDMIHMKTKERLVFLSNPTELASPHGAVFHHLTQLRSQFAHG